MPGDYRNSLSVSCSNFKCFILLLTLIYLSVFLFYSVLLAYISVGIYFLSNDFYLRDLCPQSQLWNYCLASIIFSGNKYVVYLLQKFSKKSYKFINKINVVTLVIEVSLIILGGFGLFDHRLACDNDNTDLWKFGISSFLLQIIYSFVATYRIIDWYVHGEPPVKPIDPKFVIKMEDMENDVFIKERGIKLKSNSLIQISEI